jgi:uncharacterized repeat protein (TIGR03803 family)
MRQSVGLVSRTAGLAGLVLAPVLASNPAFAWTERLLHSFTLAEDGGQLRSTLILDGQGNVYGTTTMGGANNAGTVFKITPNRVETILYTFTGGADGGNPTGGPLVMDSQGNLYGTTTLGGQYGVGTIFKITPGVGESVLYTFTYGRVGNDGGYPAAGLTADSSGNLYGTTFDAGAHGWGTVFEYSASGIFSTLYSFSGYPSDGARPYSGVYRDSSGNLYGTTSQGGPVNGGTIYEIPAGGVGKVLYSFTNGNDGSAPSAGVVEDSQGNLLGSAGGGKHGAGNLFALSPTGTLTVIYSFYGKGDGSYLYSSLTPDALGNFYGATYSGGHYDDGLIFKLSPQNVGGAVTWTKTLIMSLDVSRDGMNPTGSLAVDSAGYIYGTTRYGGSGSYGTAFRARAAQ